MYLFPTGVGKYIGPANTAPAGNTISCSTLFRLAAFFTAFCSFAPFAAAFPYAVFGM
jgi:hypothetical protein